MTKMEKNGSIPFSAWFLLIVLTLIWGASFFLIKQSLEFFDPVQLSYFRVSVSFLFLLPFTIYKRKQIQRKDMINFLWVGLLGSAIPSYLFALAEQEIEGYLAGMLNSITPLWTIIFSSILFKKHFPSSKWIALLIGFFGALILFYQDNMFSNADLNLIEHMFYVVIATALYSISANVISYKLDHVHPFTIAAASFAIIGPVALVLLFSSDIVALYTQDHPAMWTGTFSALSLAILATAIGLVLFNKLIQASNLVFATSITYLLPLVAILIDVYLGENLEVHQIIGIIVILFAVYLVKRK